MNEARDISQKINTSFKVLFYIFLGATIFLTFYKPALPGHEELLPEIKNPPEQEAVDESDIKVKIEDFSYTLEPKFSYGLYGLVVSLYDSDSFLDISHKNDPNNVRDLCVVWGENAKNSDYQKIKYKSGEFTCFFRWKGDRGEFNPKDLSNNHIIPKNSVVSDIVRDVNIGDQIYIEGLLVDYSVKLPDDSVAFKRSTSTTRGDAGNGACEIIYVENIEILKRGNAWFYTSKKIARWGIWVLLALWIIFNIVTSKYKKKLKKI